MPAVTSRLPAGAAPFRNFGVTLGLLRGLSGKSQAQVARESQCGKSQLSKYENGQELPKLETLGRILPVLDVSPLGFFFALAVVDDLQEKRQASAGDLPAAPILPLLKPGGADAAFTQLVSGFLQFYRLTHLDLLRRTLISDDQPQDA